MKITDPGELLDAIDTERLHEILGTAPAVRAPVQYVEPAEPEEIASTSPTSETAATEPVTSAKTGAVVAGKIQTLGDYIDTDAISPSDCLVGTPTIEEMGQWCLKYTHPDFRRRVKEEGLNIVVAGKAFGVGSSRETAVTALLGAGVKCVIAKSYSFIYARNQPALGLLGIIMNDEEFYALVKDGEEISIDVDARLIKIAGKEFPFTLSELEIKLWQQGGMTAAFRAWGNGILEKLTGGSKPTKKQAVMERSKRGEELQW
jgi:3-isopropylmalate dehydratase small subunit